MALGNNINRGKEENASEGEKSSKDVEATKSSANSPDPETKSTETATQKSKSSEKDSTKSLEELNQNIERVNLVDEDHVMLVTFPVGEEDYAFVIDQIKEVVPIPPISPVPQTKSFIRGVSNVRGNVLAVIDLAKRFGLKVDAEEYSNYVIVIKSEEIKVAVVSSQVPETIMVPASKIDDTADVMRKTNNDQGFIKGVVKKDDRMIILIDILEMLENEQAVNA